MATKKSAAASQTKMPPCVKLELSMEVAYESTSEIPELIASIVQDWVPDPDRTTAVTRAVLSFNGQTLDVTPKPYELPPPRRYTVEFESICRERKKIEVHTEAERQAACAALRAVGLDHKVTEGSA